MYQNEKSGIYYADFRINGKRTHRSLKTKNEKAAAKMEAELKQKIKDAALIPEWLRVAQEQTDVSLKELFDDAYNEKWQYNTNPTENEHRIDKILEIVEDTPLVSIDMNKLRDTLLTRGISAGTINRYRSAILTAINIGKELGKVSEGYRMTWKKAKEPNGRIRYIDKEIINEAVEKADGDLGELIQVLVETGARLSEIVNLKEEDVDFNTSTVKLYDTKNGTSRAVPMTEKVREILGKKGMGRKQGTFFQFTANTYGKHMIKLNKKLGDNKFTLHELRHTAASRLAHNGCDAFTIQSLLGHSSVTTSQRYVHMSGERLRDVVSLLEG